MTVRISALLSALLLPLTAGAAEQAADPHSEVQARQEAPGPVEVNPRYLLMDTSGRAISDEDFAGRFQLIAFGYTSCPSVCPGTLATMSMLLARLGEDARRIQPIFISVDPERDTPVVLEAYTRNFDARILGLTGSPELIRRAAEHFKASYRKYVEPGADPKDYSMDHSVGMYLVGPDGRFLTRFGWSAAPESILESLRARIAAFKKQVE